jgi:plastocyanin
MKSIIEISALGVLLAAVFPAEAAHSAELRGVVKRPPVKAEFSQRIERYRATGVAATSERTADCACQPSLYSVIWLTGEALPPIKLPSEPPVMAQKDKIFTPSVMAVPVGTTVSFPNFDPFFHNVFSYSKPKKFDLGRYAQGKSAEVKFDKPGIVNLFCEIHYSMKAYIHVLATPYFAVSDEKGNFQIPDIAPGRYTLHLWQENQPEITREIEIDQEPLVLELQ